MRFDEAAEDFLTEYRVNRRRSYEHAKRRVDRSLKLWFQGRRMALITTADVQRYVEARQKDDAANRDDQPGTVSPQAYVLPRHQGRQAPPSAAYSDARGAQRALGGSSSVSSLRASGRTCRPTSGVSRRSAISPAGG